MELLDILKPTPARQQWRARAEEAIQAAVATTLASVKPVTALAVANAAEAGDEFSRDLVMETANYLARGIATIAHIIDPEAIILGGAMNFGGNRTKLGVCFLERIKEHVKNGLSQSSQTN